MARTSTASLWANTGCTAWAIWAPMVSTDLDAALPHTAKEVEAAMQAK